MSLKLKPTQILKFPFIIGALLSIANVTWVNDDVRIHGVNGGVVAIPIPEDAEAVFLAEKKLLQVANHAIVPIDLETEAGTYQIDIRHGTGKIDSRSFEVSTKQYPEQYITIEDETKVTPPPDVLERIAREAAVLNEVYQLRTEQQDDLIPVTIPVDGPVSGVFGSRRFFNGLPRNPHSGIDYAAPEGTPILAPLPGAVALTGDFYFTGNTVLLDHGAGMISVLCHLHEIEVKDGQLLKKGERLGTVGSTGRSTGPHLHWTIRMQGTRVDPAVLMEVFNSLSDDG